jgi:hypothetical protein
MLRHKQHWKGLGTGEMAMSDWTPGECCVHLPSRLEGVVEAVGEGWAVFCPFGKALGHGFTVRVEELRPRGYVADPLEGLLAEVGLL